MMHSAAVSYVETFVADKPAWVPLASVYPSSDSSTGSHSMMSLVGSL